MSERKSLVQAVGNANSIDLSIIQLPAAAAVLAMSKSILIVCALGHYGLPGNELDDHQAKLGAAHTLPDDSLSYMKSSHTLFLYHPPIQHKRLKEIYTHTYIYISLMTETSFPKTWVPF